MTEKPTSELINDLHALCDQKRGLSNELKKIEESMREIKSDLISRFLTDKIEVLASNRASATLTETTVPNITDWDAFHAYCRDNDALYLLERRPSVTAWRELHNAGETPPGTAPFTKYDINLRTR